MIALAVEISVVVAMLVVTTLIAATLLVGTIAVVEMILGILGSTISMEAIRDSTTREIVDLMIPVPQLMIPGSMIQELPAWTTQLPSMTLKTSTLLL